MKRFALSLLLVLVCHLGYSQKLYFVYLQSEPEQPFFVKIEDKIHSSTGSGYLILSRLRDSVYAITVGFPENRWPEQKFTLNIRARDHGYSLKNAGDQGWGLYDVETNTLQSSMTGSGQKSKTEPREVSQFTEILSRAANDPSLKERPVVVKEEKPAVVQPPPKEEVLNARDSDIAKKELPVEPLKVTKQETTKKEENPTKTDAAANRQELPTVTEPAAKKVDTIAKLNEPLKEVTSAKEYRRSTVTKRSESSTTQGLSLTYVDDYGDGKRDTIRILIPNPKITQEDKRQAPREEKKFLDLAPPDTLHKVGKAEPVHKATKTDSVAVTATKKTCAGVATENDFLRIRKNMAAETNDDGMVAAAKKYFKSKCFSSLQVKNLSALFLNDAGKYKFFDAAYQYVTDRENFATLVSELKDDYYTNRFKAMLR